MSSKIQSIFIDTNFWELQIKYQNMCFDGEDDIYNRNLQGFKNTSA